MLKKFKNIVLSIDKVPFLVLIRRHTYHRIEQIVVTIDTLALEIKERKRLILSVDNQNI